MKHPTDSEGKQDSRDENLFPQLAVGPLTLTGGKSKGFLPIPPSGIERRDDDSQGRFRMRLDFIEHD